MGTIRMFELYFPRGSLARSFVHDGCLGAYSHIPTYRDARSKRKCKMDNEKGVSYHVGLAWLLGNTALYEPAKVISVDSVVFDWEWKLISLIILLVRKTEMER